MKYITRWRHKNGLEDLLKAKVYIDELIRQQGGQVGLTPRTISDLNSRIQRSSEKYGEVKNQAECLGALRLEVHEVEHEMWARDDAKLYEELLDVANVCIRYAQVLRAKIDAEKVLK